MDDYYTKQLRELFSDIRTEEEIQDVINIVLQSDLDSKEETLEEMINFLVLSGNSTMDNTRFEDCASGINWDYTDRVQELNNKLLKIFPDICQEYLRDFCAKNVHMDYQTIVTEIAQSGYAKEERDPLDVWEQLKQMLPSADPVFLGNQARVLANRPHEELQQFVENAIEKNDYPTMKEYLRNKEKAADVAFYTTNFSVAAFLEQIANPVETFFDPKRKSLLSEDEVNQDDIDFALNCLYNHFIYQRKREIQKIFFCYDKHLINTWNRLKTLPKAFRYPRKITDVRECKNIALLQEAAFLKHEKIIRQFIKQKNEKYRTAFEEAQKWNILQTCACCFDDQLIPEECFFCNKGCTFCKDCVKRGAATVIGKEETRFPCLADCDSEFHYFTLQMVLDKKTFERVCKRKQLEDIKRANIDGLETCPFCDFCMIPNEDDKIFKCQNIDCLKETCRQCRHAAHIPLKCEEIEYDEDVKLRVFIENKMTEALLRKCWKCGLQFYKESGCNKMTCTCGAHMCYVCGKSVEGYEHFNKDTCPIDTDNLHEFHVDRVRQGAENAKRELGIDGNTKMIKFDPVRGIENDVY